LIVRAAASRVPLGSRARAIRGIAATIARPILWRLTAYNHRDALAELLYRGTEHRAHLTVWDDSHRKRRILPGALDPEIEGSIVRRILGEQLKPIGNAAQRSGLRVSEDRAGRQRRPTDENAEGQSKGHLEPDPAGGILEQSYQGADEQSEQEAVRQDVGGEWRHVAHGAGSAASC
jgi:hypothetical protein